MPVWSRWEPAAPSPTDAELMARCARGDRDALVLLHRRHHGILYGLAARILGDRGAAEEVVQDVFLRIWRSAPAYVESGALSAWMILICRRVAIDRLRQRPGGRMAVFGPDGDPGVADPAPTPDDVAVQDDVRTRVRAAVDALNADQRRLIDLLYFDGLSQREAATHLGIPLGTVKSRVRLAFAHLRHALRSEEVTRP